MRLLSSLVPLLLLFVFLPGLEADEPVFQAGISRVNIDPPTLPIIRNGSMMAVTATEVEQSLHTRSLVLKSAEETVAIVVVDSCMLDRELCDRAKALAAEQTGIAEDRILISATHTHAAPSAMRCLGTPVVPEYVEFLIPKIAEGIRLAFENLEPAAVTHAAADARDFTHPRRWIRLPGHEVVDPYGGKTGRAHMHPGRANPTAAGPSGPSDRQLTILAVQRPDGSPLAILGNLSMHYFKGGMARLTSDYTGRVCCNLEAKMEQRHPERPFLAMMSQGTSGDTQWMDYTGKLHPKIATFESYCDALATLMDEALADAQYDVSPQLEMAESKLTLQRRLPDAERLAWARPIVEATADLPRNRQEVYAAEALWIDENPSEELKLQALRVGDLGITAIPNEVYSLTGIKIKLQSPFPTTMNIELANGAVGYIPPPEQFPLGGYTTWEARTAGLETQAEPKITEAVLSLLESVASSPRKQVSDTVGRHGKNLLTENPVAWWRLSEHSGNRAVDASGNGHTAALSPGYALFLEGPSGQGLESTPMGNRAIHFAAGKLLAPPEIPANGDYTVSFWVWNAMPVSSRPVAGYLVSIAAPGAQGGDHLGIGGTAHGANGRLQIYNGNHRRDRLLGKTPLERHRWYHVTLSRKGEQVRVTLNGKLEIDGALPDARDAEARLLFGQRHDGFAPFEGRLDEIAFFDRAIDTSQLLEGVEIPTERDMILPDPEKPGAAAAAAAPKNPTLPDHWKKDATGFAFTRNHPSIRLLDAVPTFLEHDKASPGPETEQTWLHFTTQSGAVKSQVTGSEFHLRGIFKWGWRNTHHPKARRAEITIRSGEKPEPIATVAIQEGMIGDLTGLGRTLNPVKSSTIPYQITNQQGFWHPDGAEYPSGEWNQLDVVLEKGTLNSYVNGCRIAAGALPVSGEGYHLSLENLGSEMWWKSIRLGQPAPVQHFAEWQKNDTLDKRNYPLTPEASMARMQFDGDYTVELVAAEPLIHDPVEICFADDGSLYVVEMRDYPLPDVGGPTLSRIKRLFDDDGDGRMDRAEIFADDILFPNGIAPYRDGFIATAQTHLLFLADRDGDGRAEHRETWMNYPPPTQSQLDVSSPRWRLDGRLHLNNGLRGSEVTPVGGAKVATRNRNFAFDPMTRAVETMPGPGQFGAGIDQWGRHYSCSNRNPTIGAGFSIAATTRSQLPYGLPSVTIDVAPAQSDARVAPLFASRQTDQGSGYHSAACGLSVYHGAALPQLDGHLFVCDPTGPVITRSALVPDGPTMKAERIQSNGSREFFQTGDIWCRPVNLRNGPGGALYLVDMYRQYIDHSKFWRIDFQSENNMRAGADHGRIYRIVAKGSSTPAFDPVAEPKALVAKLSSPNIWERRRAQRLLLESETPADPNIITHLADLVTSGSEVARAHALSILARLDRLEDATLVEALRVESTELRRIALEIAGTRLADSTNLLAAVRGLTHPDHDIAVRYPAMLAISSMGSEAWRSMELGKLDHPYLTAVIGSSLDASQAGDCFLALARSAREPDNDTAELRSFLKETVEILAREEGNTWLETLVTMEVPDSLRETLLLAYSAESLRTAPVKFQRQLDSASAETRAIVASLQEKSQERALDLKQDTEVRRTALRLVKASQPTMWAEVVTAILGRAEDPVAFDLVQLHLTPATPDATTLILDRWPNLPSELRNIAMARIFSSEEAMDLLLDRIEAEQIDPATLSTGHRRHFRRVGTKRIAQRAAKLVPLDPTGAARLAIVREYQEAVPKLEGDRGRGLNQFRSLCATCHEAHGEGVSFGPGLTDLGGHDPANLLQSIIHPNSEIEDRWAMVIATAKDGGIVSGLLDENSPTVLRLKLPGGLTTAIDKSEIATIDFTEQSLMPEGLETALGHQGMADLLAFLNGEG